MVLPGTAAPRITDKRRVRRHFPTCCTTEEGVKEQAPMEWRLVDGVVPTPSWMGW
jgi:hypothetical protein